MDGTLHIMTECGCQLIRSITVRLWRDGRLYPRHKCGWILLEKLIVPQPQ
jgi:hypothetical protein